MDKEQCNQDNIFYGRDGLVYNRVSSKKQETEGNGLGSQELRCIQELKTLNVPHKKPFGIVLQAEVIS